MSIFSSAVSNSLRAASVQKVGVLCGPKGGAQHTAHRWVGDAWGTTGYDDIVQVSVLPSSVEFLFQVFAFPFLRLALRYYSCKYLTVQKQLLRIIV